MVHFPGESLEPVVQVPAVEAELQLAPGFPDDLVEVGSLPYGGRDYRVTVGRNAEVVSHIVAGARQSQMHDMVPKDERERFKDDKTFEKWYAKDRFLVSFWDDEGNLAAVVWHGVSPLAKEKTGLQAKVDKHYDDIPELGLEDAEVDFPASPNALHTMAIRTYEGYQHMKPAGETVSFSRTVLQIGQGLYIENVAERQAAASDEAAVAAIELEEHIVWCETNEFDKDGKPNGAVFMYMKAGYERIGRYMNPDPKNVEWRVALEAPLQSVQALGALALLER